MGGLVEGEIFGSGDDEYGSFMEALGVMNGARAPVSEVECGRGRRCSRWKPVSGFIRRLLCVCMEWVKWVGWIGN